MNKPKKIHRRYEMRTNFERMTAIQDSIKLLEGLGVLAFKLDLMWNPVTGHTVIEWEETI